MLKPDQIRVRHMLDAAKEALSFISGKSRENLDFDRQLVLAITREVEIIGEAASKISQEARDAHPGIPWLQIIQMRNRLVHVYFDVDLNVVWDTVTIDLPALVEKLEKISDAQF